MTSALALLRDEVVRLVAERGWEKLTDIQEEAIPLILNGYHVLIIAPTGYGKTEAALLPIFSLMVKENPKPVSLIYVTPLRALINDIYERIRWWASHLGLRVARKHGDVPQAERARRLRDVPHILVTTPESLEVDLDWAPRFREHLANVRWVVIDEVHEIVASKRGVQLAVLLERLRRLAGDFQMVLLSATVGDPHLVVRAFLGSSRRRYAIIQSRERKPVHIVVDYVDSTTNDFWLEAAKTILAHAEPLTLVFVNSKHVAERLHKSLEKLNAKAVIHHASISAEERERVEKMAKEGKIGIIICTKTLELGIDIGYVRKVILFRPSGSVFTLLQRVGRSGHRIATTSKGVIIATDPLELVEAVTEALLAVTGGTVEAPELPEAPLDVAAKAILGMALSSNYTVEDVYNILSSVWYFRNLTRDKFTELIELLARNKLIVIGENGKMSVGPGFYRIWRFNSGRQRAWWVRSFTEFFSNIGERDVFTVRTRDGRLVGELDTAYVYRSVRIGTVVRLGGRNWRVVGIDEYEHKLVVEPAPEGEPAIPFWRGQGPEVTKLVVESMVTVIRKLAESHGATGMVELTERAQNALKNLMEDPTTLTLDTSTLLVDRVGDEIAILYPFGERVSRTLAYAVLAEADRRGIDAQVRVSFYGFMVRSSDPAFNPLEVLLSMDPYELYNQMQYVVARTPYYSEVLQQLRIALGCVGKGGELEDLVREEAERQVLAMYFDLEGAGRLLEALKSGKIRIIVNQGSATIYTRQLARELPEKLWTTSIDYVIAKAIKGMAFTVEEISEITGLPERIVEHKLREMRKPGTRYRVFSFYDVDTGEERWALIDDADKIVVLEEFTDSFKPKRLDSLYLVLVKTLSRALHHVIVRVAELVREPGSLLRNIPVDEVYELKIVPLSAYDSSIAVKYSYVPRNLVPYLVLNGIALLERLSTVVD